MHDKPTKNDPVDCLCVIGADQINEMHVGTKPHLPWVLVLLLVVVVVVVVGGDRNFCTHNAQKPSEAPFDLPLLGWT